jgi:hypothetical protein
MAQWWHTARSTAKRRRLTGRVFRRTSTMHRRLFPLSALLLGALLGAALPSSAQDIGFHGWGLRAGLSDDPDQVVVGAQANLGEFIPRLRFQPNLEVGLGDDTTVVSLTAPVFYRALINNDFTLYGGGGVTVGAIDSDLDDGQGDDEGTEFEIAPMLAGGLEWPIAQGAFFGELALTGGDFAGVKLVAGWMF